MAMRPGTYAKAAKAEAGKARGEKDNLSLLVQYFEDAEEVTTDSRRLAERDRDYYDNKQLTAAELAALKKRGQPDVIINRIQTKVNYLLGYEAAQRTDPRGFPRTPQDEDAAAACSDALNFVREKTQLAQTFSLAWENMLIEGLCGGEVGVVPDGQGDAEITVTHWDWDRLFADPHSRRHDFTDARYLGGVIWMDEDEAKNRWPDSEDVIARTVTEEASKTYSDRPTWKQWAQPGTRKRVRIVQMYHKEGDTWMWCIFTKAGKLAYGEVPYRDEDGNSLCPLVMQSAFVDRENNRYGFVRALIGPQDEINKRRSKSLHLLMGRPFQYEEGAIDDVDEAKMELAKANGAVKVNPGMKFELMDNTQELQGHLGLLQEAKNEIDNLGPNASMQGKGDRSASGRAIMANQQGGQIEIYRLVDRHANYKLRIYKLIWAVIRQYWSEKKWLRVTDEEKNVRWVGLNVPVTLAEDMLEQAEKAGIPREQAEQEIAMRAKDPLVAQQLQQVVRVKNIPADMEMDIILEEVPDAANSQQEQFEILAKLAPAVVFPPEVYINASALRNKAKLLEILDGSKNKPDPAQEAAKELELEKLRKQLEEMSAKIEKLKADTAKSWAEADATDAQLGQVIQPQVIDMSQGGQQPMPMPMPQGGQGLPFDPMAGQGMPQVDPAAMAEGQGLPIDGGFPPPVDPTFVPGAAPVMPDQGQQQF